jgi:phosphoribosylpyrophosphate synthetase
MELLLTISTLKRNGAKKIIAVVPYMAFGRKRGKDG